MASFLNMFTNHYEIETRSGSKYSLQFLHAPGSKHKWLMRKKDAKQDEPWVHVFALYNKDRKFVRISEITRIEEFLDCIVCFDKKEMPHEHLETYENNPGAINFIAHTSRVVAWH